MKVLKNHKCATKTQKHTHTHTPESKLEAAVVFCVFGVTGSTSVALVRPSLKNVFGLEGNMRDGPWSYRIISIVAVSPIYACCLMTFGTLAGRHNFFAYMSHKIFGRFVPKSISSRIGCPPAFARREAAPIKVTPPVVKKVDIK
jgi:hypothetical protein